MKSILFFREQLKNEDILNTARLRLTLYKAAINPAYISNSSNDPILTAFRLSNELMQRSVIEPNFRSEYINIADQTRQFAVDLIGINQTKKKSKCSKCYFCRGQNFHFTSFLSVKPLFYSDGKGLSD